MGLVDAFVTEVDALAGALIDFEGLGEVVKVADNVIETMAADGVRFIADSHFINVIHFPDSEFMFVPTIK